MNKKITELDEANDIEDEDILMIVQNNKNKKIKIQNIKIHKYTLPITADTAKGSEVTLPCNYKVRQ